MRAYIRIRWDVAWLDEAGNDRFPQRKTEAWQRERWDLFMRYTLPSLQRQTHEDWVALLFCDYDLDRPIFDSGDKRVLWTPGYPDELCAVAGEVPAETGYVMRMDSDDMLAAKAIETLIEHAPRLIRPPEGPLYSQLDTGAAYHPASDTVYSWPNPSPPFYGRLWDMSSGRIPEFGHHMKDRELARPIKTDDPMFCVVLHDLNICNKPSAQWCQPMLSAAREARTRELFGLPARGDQ